MQVPGTPASNSATPAPAPATPAANPAPADPANPTPAAASAPDPNTPNPAPATPAAAAPAPAPTRPDWAPETFWDAEKGQLKGEDIGKILASHAERQADIITDPAKVAIKSDLKDKDGNPITFNTDSPLLKAAAEMGAKRGWTNGDLTAMAEIVATAQLAAKEAEDADILALGNGDRAKADARLQAVLTKGAALIAADEKGNPSPEATKALATLVASIHSRGEFETLEKLINAAGGPNAAAAGGGGEVVDIAKRWYPNEGKKAG